ncbi:MAG: thymidine phosphorylase family protein, partial [Gammaproteobacteria bacterium]
MPRRASALVRLRRAGIDTYQVPVIFMREDCTVCRSEGFEALSRVEIRREDRTLIATLNVVSADWLAADEAALSEWAWRRLGVEEGDTAELRHPDPVDSLSALRAKVYGRTLQAPDIAAIVGDVAAGRYSELELAAFVTACAGERLDFDETIALTRAMVEVGERLSWPHRPVMDKHSIGGIPGNRTTLIVVPIVAACGLTIPKTSSRAITSPAGSADTMETLAPVDLSIEQIRGVVEREGGCIAWGGSVRLSPADDILIRVERPLDFDSEGQLVASVLSKKLAAGSTHVVIDIPVGPTAKVRTPVAAQALGERLRRVGAILGLEVAPVSSDGSQPVGRGIGPALEARDVLAVLQNDVSAPDSLRSRSLDLAGAVLELAAHAPPGQGRAAAERVLASGQAWRKFQAIAEAQGGLREPPVSRFHQSWPASAGGHVSAFDNRKLSRLAKLAGAPRSLAAGLDLHVRLGERVEIGQPLFTLHAD